MEVNKNILSSLEENHSLEAGKTSGLFLGSRSAYKELMDFYKNRYTFTRVDFDYFEKFDKWEDVPKADVIYADNNFMEFDVKDLYGLLQPRGVLVIRCYTKEACSDILYDFFVGNQKNLSSLAMDYDYVLIYKDGKHEG
jgi:hypothetical protein